MHAPFLEVIRARLDGPSTYPVGPSWLGNAITCAHLPGQPGRGWGQCHRLAGDPSLLLTAVQSPHAAPDLGLWEELGTKPTLQ